MMKKYSLLALVALFLINLVSCSKTVSYSELLNDEEEATNWFLANQKIVTTMPEDSVFECGEDAPFYRMDEDGYIYMQVINPGTKDNRVELDELIYFRYMRTNIKEWYQLGYEPTPQGNANNMNSQSTSFRFNNTTLNSSYKYGSGIQLPLKYLGVDCEVNLLLRSYYGFIENQSDCIPFLYNVRYFRSQM